MNFRGPLLLVGVELGEASESVEDDDNGGPVLFHILDDRTDREHIRLSARGALLPFCKVGKDIYLIKFSIRFTDCFQFATLAH